MSPQLTAGDFVDNQLEPIIDCSLCGDPYGDAHMAVRIPACNHIAGKACLVKWFESNMGNANTCPFCRTELFRKYDSDDPEAHLQFLQRLWNEVANVALRHAKERPRFLFPPARCVLEDIVEALQYGRIQWPNPQPRSEVKEILILLAETMYIANKCEMSSSAAAVPLEIDCAALWFEVVWCGEGNDFEFETLHLAVQELPEAISFDGDHLMYMMIRRRFVLEWFTMMLARDIAKNFENPDIWFAIFHSYSHVSTQNERVNGRMERRIERNIGAMLEGVCRVSFAKRAVKIAKILFRFQYPARAPNRSFRLADTDESLRWLWTDTDKLFDIYCCHLPSRSLLSTTSTKNTPSPLQHMKTFTYRCWYYLSDRISTMQSTSYRTPKEWERYYHKVIAEAASASHVDFWSAFNIITESTDKNLVDHHRNLLRTLTSMVGLMNRVLTLDYRICMGPLLCDIDMVFVFFLANVTPDQWKPLNWSTMEDAAAELSDPDLPGSVRLWWFTMMLSREIRKLWMLDRDTFWADENIVRNVEGLLHGWQGDKDHCPTIPFLHRTVNVVRHLLHVQAEGKKEYISGRDDCNKALSLWRLYK